MHEYLKLNQVCDAMMILAPGTESTTEIEVNSLAPGKFEWNFMYVIFKRILVIDGWSISFEIMNVTGLLVQVMAWCRQATSHYLSQCWPRYQSPYGVTRPEWVKLKDGGKGGGREIGIQGLQCLPWSIKNLRIFPELQDSSGPWTFPFYICVWVKQ